MDADLSSSQDYLLLLLPAFTTFLSPLLAILVVVSLVWLYLGGPAAWALSRWRQPPPPGAPQLTALWPPSRGPGDAALVSFSVGLTRFVVASCPDTARELLTSAAFADRPVKDAARSLLFHRAMVFAPSGDYWRVLRRLSATHLFNARLVAASAPCRLAIGKRIIEQLSAGRGGEVAMTRVLHAASLEHVMATVFSTRYDAASRDGVELEEIVKEGYELLGMFNWGDHLPLLKWLDLQGVRRCRSLVSRVDVFVRTIIEDHKQIRRSGTAAGGNEVAGDFVDVLLGLEGDQKLSDSDMVVVLWVRTM